MAESAAARFARSLIARKKSVPNMTAQFGFSSNTESGSATALAAGQKDTDATVRTTNAGTFVYQNNPHTDRTSGYGHTAGTNGHHD